VFSPGLGQRFCRLVENRANGAVLLGRSWSFPPAGGTPCVRTRCRAKAHVNPTSHRIRGSAPSGRTYKATVTGLNPDCHRAALAQTIEIGCLFERQYLLAVGLVPRKRTQAVISSSRLAGKSRYVCGMFLGLRSNEHAAGRLWPATRCRARLGELRLDTK